MMTIKFRAWDRKEKSMRQVSLIEFDDDGLPSWIDILTPEDQDPESDVPASVSVSSDNVELMQFTGLKDSKGREIYEGDIIKVTAEDGTSYVAPVKWFGRDGYPAFDLDGKYIPDAWSYEAIALSTLSESGVERFEAIGNVWQNAELLEAKP
jgi:uncharacterized phage protein (TIGR01671 family)